MNRNISLQLQNSVNLEAYLKLSLLVLIVQATWELFFLLNLFCFVGFAFLLLWNQF